jgi:hypothetical protein
VRQTRGDCLVNIAPIGSLVRVHLVEVVARCDPFFVTALWGAAAAATSREVLIAAARSTRLRWARFHPFICQWLIPPMPPLAMMAGMCS